MNSLSALRMAALGTLAAGAFTAALPTFADSPERADPARLLAQADHHSRMAEDYRARMRTDPKHAISWFTMANHCDRHAQALRTAAAEVSGESGYRR
jgi:hypothetical protein